MLIRFFCCSLWLLELSFTQAGHDYKRTRPVLPQTDVTAVQFILFTANTSRFSYSCDNNATTAFIASDHVSDLMEEQIFELNETVKTGIDALILITNRLAKEEEGEEVRQQNLNNLLDAIPPAVSLGFYECPYPYKRLIFLDQMSVCARTGRFYFIKDTCCDTDLIKERLKVLEGTRLKLYNANTTKHHIWEHRYNRFYLKNFFGAYSYAIEFLLKSWKDLFQE